MNVRNQIVLAGLSVLLISCGVHRSAVVRSETQALRAEAQTSYFERRSDGHTWAHGHLDIFPKHEPFAWVNLNCFKLKVGERTSKSIYVASLGSIIADHISPGDNGEISWDVYWVFDNEIPVADQTSSPVKLVFEPAGALCYDLKR